MAVPLACPRDSFERSDIDLAVETPDMDRYDGLKIELDFEDEAPTYWRSTCCGGGAEHLRQQIRDEGILAYERARAQAPV